MRRGSEVKRLERGTRIKREVSKSEKKEIQHETRRREEEGRDLTHLVIKVEEEVPDEVGEDSKGVHS